MSEKQSEETETERRNSPDSYREESNAFRKPMVLTMGVRIHPSPRFQPWENRAERRSGKTERRNCPDRFPEKGGVLFSATPSFHRAQLCGVRWNLTLPKTAAKDHHTQEQIPPDYFLLRFNGQQRLRKKEITAWNDFFDWTISAVIPPNEVLHSEVESHLAEDCYLVFSKGMKKRASQRVLYSNISFNFYCATLLYLNNCPSIAFVRTSCNLDDPVAGDAEAGRDTNSKLR